MGERALLSESRVRTRHPGSDSRLPVAELRLQFSGLLRVAFREIGAFSQIAAQIEKLDFVGIIELN